MGKHKSDRFLCSSLLGCAVCVFNRYKKMREQYPDSDLGGFTRLLHTGKEDALMDVIPTVVVEPEPPEKHRVRQREERRCGAAGLQSRVSARVESITSERVSPADAIAIPKGESEERAESH